MVSIDEHIASLFSASAYTDMLNSVINGTSSRLVWWFFHI